ncbi:ABC transporter ATP-binding protein [Pararhodonellum marinum]|uniref:ABC transporter ATP-binding protein n=1 Tax=Pararhodonellum marinum TaxID=2755358 RepID=UPI00188FCC6D|nr:ABC transporter ATP-binding protein [Pararhodonellum marinum]
MKDTQPENSATQTILHGNALRLGYQNGNNTFLVAENISFDLAKGQLTCLLGPNGVGKSTLLKAILGQHPPLSGEIYYQGKKLSQLSHKDLARKIAVVLTDKVTTGNLTVAQLVALGRIPHTGWLGNLRDTDISQIDASIEATHVGYLRDRRLSELSDGQLQKVMIARALAQDGEILVLDEPTAHLDLANRFEIMHLLRNIALRKNKAVLVVTHDLDIALDTADRFWLMPCGSPLVTGIPEDLVLSEQINLLLPDQHLFFSKESGKVQTLDHLEPPLVQGPDALTQWVKKAMLKRGLTLEMDMKLEVIPHPFEIRLKSGQEIFRFGSIQEFFEAESWKTE